MCDYNLYTETIVELWKSSSLDGKSWEYFLKCNRRTEISEIIPNPEKKMIILQEVKHTLLWRS